MRPINRTRILIGAGALVIGLVVYLTDRPPNEDVLPFPDRRDEQSLSCCPATVWASGWNLPAFLHVFALILVTGGILACRERGSLVVAVSWLLTEWAFEIGQKFSVRAEALVPRWFDSIPVLEITRNYFRVGTFDPLDMVAVAVGAAAAYSVLLATIGTEVSMRTRVWANVAKALRFAALS